MPKTPFKNSFNYSVMGGKAPTPWRVRIKNAKINTSRDIWNDMVRDAKSWVTCACGQQHHELYSGNTPSNEEMINLGAKFAGYIGAMDECALNNSRRLLDEYKKKALATLVKIDRLAAKLLNEMHNKA